jgi:ATP-dependent helicase YprA (DUF1998 family)
VSRTSPPVLNQVANARPGLSLQVKPARDARKAIRQRGHMVLTNPDMLHTGILPHHTTWIRLFENLRYIVLDEVQTYRGVFGSHLAHVLRRLNRVATFLRSAVRLYEGFH